MNTKNFNPYLWFTRAILLITMLLSPGYFPASPQLIAPGAEVQGANGAGNSEVALPLVFEENQGQTDQQVRFMVRAGEQNLYLTPTEVVMKLSNPRINQDLPSSENTSPQPGQPSPAVLHMQFRNANPEVQLVGQDQLPGVVNYYLGRDPANWYSGIPTYAAVRYLDLYPGVDLRFYGNGRQVEYDFIVAPGSSPQQIAVQVLGTHGMRLDLQGNLLLDSGNRAVTLRKPVIYQEKDGLRLPIRGEYFLNGADTYAFQVGNYDRSLPLVIDPVIDFSTYFGGSGTDYGYSIVVDQVGNLYMTGATNSPDFPLANGYAGAGSRCPSDLPTRECFDAFVTKINADRTAILYSTYIGNPGEDEGRAIAVDSAGNAYITGLVSLAGAPPLDDMYLYGYALVVKLDQNGSMVYGFAWGESSGEIGYGIDVDAQGQAYVAGEVSGSIITTQNALQPEKGEMMDGFITVFNASGTGIVYSTYLGGSGPYCNVCSSKVNAIVVDTQGNIYVTGQAAPSFPTTSSAYRQTFDGLWEAFVAKINPAQAGLAGLIYATYLGGVKTEIGTGIALDSAGKVYITGSTDSNDFPTTVDAFDRACGSDGICNPTTVCDNNLPPRCYTDPKTDIFVAKMDLSKSGAASLVYSTYIGGAGQDVSQGIVVDGSANTYVTGYTWSPDFPMANPLDATYAANDDIVLFQISPNGALPFSTYIGGGGEDHAYSLALTSNGLYLTGYTGSGAFPTVNPILNRSTQMEAFLTHVTLTTGLPGAFNKTTPSNGASGVSTDPSLTWNPSSGATSYEYCYDTTNDGACANWVSAGSSTHVKIYGLTESTTYYWQVRAKNSGGATYASGGWSNFSTHANLDYKVYLPLLRR